MIPPISFHLVGVSHHTAALAIRERLSLSPDEVSALLAAEALSPRPGVLLCTCNRCELYTFGEEDGAEWFAAFARMRGAEGVQPTARASGADAVRHLFTVVAGLDSQILGETEILGQTRRAHEMARAAGATTPELDAIFTAALQAGRRARRETNLGRHPQSVSGAAIHLAAARLGTLEGRRIVVIGAGQAAEGALRELRTAGARDIVLVNRRLERAQQVAEAYGARAHPWDVLDLALADADLAITAIATSRPVMSAERLAAAVQARPERPLWILDLAVPRNVAPEARDVPGVRVFDLDDLQERYCPTDAPASPALAAARRIVEEELVRLGTLLRGRAAAPRLAALHRLGDQVVAEETERLLRQLGPLDPGEAAAVRMMAERVARRLLYPVSRAVREE